MLDASGLLTQPPAPGRGGAAPDAVVGSIAYDSRRGVARPRVRGAARAAGRRRGVRAGRPSRSGAVAVVAETGAARGVPRAVGRGQRRAAGARRCWPRTSTAIRAADARGRHHRHERQDDHVVPAARRSSRRPASGAACIGTVRLPHRRRRARRGAHHARGARRPAACCARWSTRAAARARWRCRRTRSRSGASTAPRFAAGGLHQPDARPPRLPRRHGAVLRGQAAAVRDAAGRRARRSSTSTTGAGPSLAASCAAPVTYGDRQARRRHAGVAAVSRSTASPSTSRTPRGPVHVRSRLVGRPNVYNILAAVATGVGARPAARGHRARARARRGGAGPLPGRVRARRRRDASSSTTRTPTTR